MSILSWIADKLILKPSTHPIDPDGKRRELIETPDGNVEAWVSKHLQSNPDEPVEVVVLKFPGAAGRAERSGVHPAEVFQVNAEIWTVNPKGYGGSSGPASIKYFPITATVAFDKIKSVWPDLPIAVVGNSLGCISALYLGACRPVSAIMLRNPPPLQQMICERPRYAAWNFGLSRWIANEVPKELDCIANAKLSKTPCLFVQSELDRVVPTKYQNLIVDAYTGPKRLFQIAGVGHQGMVGEEQQNDYFEALSWLKAEFV